MAQDSLAVASAVILPEAADTDLPSLKRRHESASRNSSKRRRLSDDRSDVDAVPAASAEASRQDPGRRPLEGGKMEERKRGRRLFGALLGVVSQSSSSTAQQRRVDIEKKQQAKLKQQEDEQDDRKKEKLDILMQTRKREQQIYDEQSMRIHHANLRAQAQFLRTKTEPHLFYKPWELTETDEDTIKAHIQNAEATISNETAQQRTDNDQIGPPSGSAADEAQGEADQKGNTVGEDAENEDTPAPLTGSDTNGKSLVHDEPIKPALSEHGGEGDDLVEGGDEDAVIY